MKVAAGPEGGVPGLTELAKNQELVFVKNPSLPRFVIPGFPNIVELEEQRIQQRAEQLGRYLYLGVSCCEIDDRVVKITVYTGWASPEDSKEIALGEGALIMGFCKHNGMWRLESLFTIIS